LPIAKETKDYNPPRYHSSSSFWCTRSNNE